MNTTHEHDNARTFAAYFIFLMGTNQASAGDIAARLAIVPMGAEARGLDAAPRLVQRLRSANDHPTAALVDMIGVQEKAHVAVGAQPWV